MCIVDKKTITHVNNRMIERVKIGHIPVQKVRDNLIIVPVHLLGRPYRMSIERVNELYGEARKKAAEVVES